MVKKYEVELTLDQIREINGLVLNGKQITNHPMIGLRCVVRTHSAGVHIGDVVWVNPNNSMEVKLENALRLWKWEGGGLSLSAVAKNGIKGGRIDVTGDVFLTNAIEYIPTTKTAEESYVKFIED
jgi:hypothetical protein